MADDLTVTPGVGAKVSADEITTLNGGVVTAVLAQRVKVGWGIDGTFNDTNAANPLPVTSVVTSLPALPAGANVIGAVTQSGTWTVGISGTVPVSIASMPALTAGSAVIGAVTQSGTWNVGTVTTVSAVTAVTTVSTVTNLSQFGGAAINLGAGAVGTGTLRVTQASDSPLVSAIGASGATAYDGTSNVTTNGLLRAIADVGRDTTTASLVKFDHTSTNDQVALGNSPAANTAKSYTGTFTVAATALTRPANVTAYTALDSISNNATAGSVTANSVSLSDTNDHPIHISEVLLASTDTGPGTAAIQIRIHLFNSDPTASTGVVGGDNAAYSNKQAGWVGSFSGTMRAFSDGSRGVLIADEGTLRLIAPVSGAKTLFWQLQAIGGFTPSANSTTFAPTFKGFQARAA